jgi:hypothetical protein
MAFAQKADSTYADSRQQSLDHEDNKENIGIFPECDKQTNAKIFFSVNST